MKHKAYILNVNPSLSAEKPTIAGPKTKPEKPMLDIWDIVLGIESFEYLIACLKIIGCILEHEKPNIIMPIKMM